MGFVYVIEYDGYYKIGKTDRTVEQRIQDMQFPFLPNIITVYETETPLQLERYLQRKLKSRKIRNEWFYFRNDYEAKILTEAYVNESKIDAWIKERKQLTEQEAINKNKQILENIIELSTVTDTNTFWDNYNHVKNTVTPDEWAKLKKHFMNNPIYKNWRIKNKYKRNISYKYSDSYN